MRSSTRHVRGDRGAVAVEFAIIFPVLFLVIAGIVDFGRAMYTEISLTNAAREGARAAIVTTGPTDGPLLRARAAAPGILTLDVTVAACAGAGSDTTVTASSPFEWILLGPAMGVFGGGGSLPATLESTAVMRCH